MFFRLFYIKHFRRNKEKFYHFRRIFFDIFYSTLKLNTIAGNVQIFLGLEFSLECSVENMKKLLQIKIWDFELFFIIMANLLLNKMFKIK